MENLCYYRCAHCGNIVEMVVDRGVPIYCCGEPMQALEANTSDGAHEKHVPVVTVEHDRVCVSIGETIHPMTDAHSIVWIALETDQGVSRRMLTPADAPQAEFCLNGAKPVAVYEYCNLHGLWKKQL